MIDTVVLWANGMVTVFDEHGEQIPEHQGRWQDVEARILDHDTPGTKYRYGVWGQSPHEITRRSFMCGGAP